MHTPILHKADASSSAQNTPSKLNNSLTLKAALGAAFLLLWEGNNFPHITLDYHSAIYFII